jgi:hypothetical protein
MGERSWARLTIGGTVSRSALAGALEALEGLRLEGCLGDHPVVVEDPEASWGGFSELEAWLQARRIPFDLESGACPGGWPDMLVHFRPGRGRVEFVSDDSHAGAGDDVLVGRVAVVGGSSAPTPRRPTATSRLTGRPLRPFDVS